jgi:hypothetical protein
VHIYIGFETLKMKCIQCGICSQVAFKNARAMFFSKLGGAGNSFRSGSKISQAGAKLSREGWPRLDLTPPIVRRRGLNVCPKKWGASQRAHARIANLVNVTILNSCHVGYQLGLVIDKYPRMWIRRVLRRRLAVQNMLIIYSWEGIWRLASGRLLDVLDLKAAVG